MTARFVYDGGPKGAGGSMTLLVDGVEVARGRIEKTLSRLWFTEGLDIGRDLLTPVNPDYRSPFAYTGTIRSVTVDLK